MVGALTRDAQGALPAGSIISGSVVKARQIGFGLRRERAILELRFDTCQSPSGEPIACSVSLQAIDNARESVLSRGRITGILAASHPHSWLGGIWVRPGNAFSARTAAGLTGTSGRLQSVILPTPIGAVLAVGSRLLLFRLPDAEIELPAGTNLILRIGSESSGDETPPAPTRFLSSGAESELAALNPTVVGAGGRSVADIVNVVLLARVSR